MPTVGQPVPGYYYDQFTDTLRPITGGPGPKGDTGNANVTVSPNAPTVAGKAGDLWVQTTTTPWTAPASMPWGIVAWKLGAGTVTLTTTLTELIRLANVPLKAGRLYVCTIGVRAFQTSVAGYYHLVTPSNVAIPGTTFRCDAVFYAPAAQYSNAGFNGVFTVPTDVSATFIINHETSAGSGNSFMDANSGIRIEDIGPNRGQQ